MGRQAKNFKSGSYMADRLLSRKSGSYMADRLLFLQAGSYFYKQAHLGNFLGLAGTGLGGNCDVDFQAEPRKPGMCQNAHLGFI